MKILYIASVRIPNEKASGLAIMRQCQAFVRLGHDVTLLRPYRKSHIVGDPFEYYGLPKDFDVQTMCSINFIESLGLFGFYMARASQMIASAFFVFRYLKNIDVIYARDPWMLVLLSLFMKRRTLIWEAHQKQVHFLIRMMAKQVTRVVCISRGLADFYAAYIGRNDIIVEPSGVELSQFEDLPSQAEVRKKLGIPLNQKVCAYIGKYSTMGESKGVDELIRAFGIVSSERINAHLLLVGLEENEIGTVKALCDSVGISQHSLTLLPLIQKDFARYVHAADVLIANYPNTEHYRSFMSPTKLFAYMASYRSIVASDLPTIREIVDESMVYFVEPDSSQSLTQGILRALTDESAQSMCGRSLERVRHFSWVERGERILRYI